MQRKKSFKSGALIIIILLMLVSTLFIKNIIFSNESGGTVIVPSNTGEYEKISLTSADIHRGELVLVNNKISYAFDEKLDLITVYESKSSNYNIKDTSISLTKNTMTAMNDMLDDFYEKKNDSKINVISGHRTFEYQKNLLAARIESQGEEEAAVWVASPGGSEHHTGLAVDFSIFNRDDGSSEPYEGKGKYAWINENSYKYGFIVRYNEDKKDITGIAYEPWHFRYIGLPHSYLVTKNKLAYEEYIDFLKDYEQGKKHIEVDFQGSTYEIYYTKENDVLVPKDEEFSISGNNVDGFIITITR